MPADPPIAVRGLAQRPSLVVLTGDAARNPARISALLDADAIIVIASSPDAIRAWLPGALLGGETPDLAHAIVRVSHLEVDPTEQRARWLDKELAVTPYELRLLATLGEELGRVWTFEQLNQRVWGTSYFGSRETIHSAVKRLRKKLAQASTDVFVESIRSVGFRLVTLAHQPEQPR